MATTMDGSVALLDADTGTLLAALQPHRKYVVKAACLQAGGDTRIVTGSWVRTLKHPGALAPCVSLTALMLCEAHPCGVALPCRLCRTGLWRCISSAAMAAAWRR